MAPPCRNQLVWLHPPGWDALRAAPWDHTARDCLAHWAAQGLPLVVTQQPVGLPADQIALGLAAPLQWQRRRLALRVARAAVARVGHFPAAASLSGLWPAAGRQAWATLGRAFDAAGVTARVHGSFGWQQLTGLACVRPGSDLDLHLAVADATAADQAVAALQALAWDGPRLDGELVFPDGAAVAWREWAAWRAGRVSQLLVKRLAGVALEAWPEALPC